MKTLRHNMKTVLLLALAALMMLCVSAAAEDGSSGDNSLYSLGLENAESIDPEFYYSTLEYNVTVAAGTTKLELDPVTSASSASIIDISGTELTDGAGTVYITVEAANGAQVSYTLHVTSSGESTAEAQSETTSADAELERVQQQSESEELLRQKAENESNKAMVDTLTEENSDLSNRLNLLMKVLYGLIAFAVVLLFFMINQSLRNKDLKDDLKEAKSQADANNEFARKEQNMQNGYYYVHNQNANQNQNMMQGMPQPMMDMSQNVQAAFGNAQQTLYAQPMQGQTGAPIQNQGAPMANMVYQMQNAAGNVQNSAANAVENVQNAAANAVNGAENAAANVQNTAANAVENVQNAAANTVNGAENAAANVQNTAADAIANAQNAAANVVNGAAANVQNVAANTVNGAENAAAATAENVQNAATLVQGKTEEPDVQVDMIDL